MRKKKLSRSIVGRINGMRQVLLALLVTPLAVSLVLMLTFNARYHRSISRMETIASLKPVIAEEIPGEVWDLVSGRDTLEETRIQEMITRVNRTIEQMIGETGEQDQLELIVAGRTMDTLRQYAEQITANVAANMNTSVGSDKGAKATINAAKATVDVRNDIASSSTPQVLAVAAGGVAVGGNVLLAFNETKAEAKLARTDLSAKNLKVVSDLQGTATSKLASETVGLVAVGTSTNYADMNASNIASVNTDDSTINVSGNMTVRTGETDHDNTSAVAETVAGSAGIVSVGVNSAIARNRAQNIARITGNQALTVGGTLTMRGYDKTTASAQITGLNIGAVAVATSFTTAFNEADTRTELKLPSLNAGKVDLSNFQKGTTKATRLTGGGTGKR